MAVLPGLSYSAPMLSMPEHLPPLALGFAAGLRHALDADHLVAMATIVSRERSLARSMLFGGFWGLGHTGLAGSGAMALVVLASARSPWVGLGAVGLFGLGSIGGMVAVSGILAIPFARMGSGTDGILGAGPRRSHKHRVRNLLWNRSRLTPG